MKKILLKYGITVIIGALMVVGILCLRDFSFQSELVEVYKELADAFTIVGVLILGVGSLVWVSTTGFFDGISYVMKHAVMMLIPGYKKKDQKFYDYKMEKESKRAKGYAFLLIVGAVFFALAVLFTVLFYTVYTGD